MPPKVSFIEGPLFCIWASILLSEKQLDQIIEKAVEKALDKKLQPINRMLAQMQNKGPSINDIFGGIGYILGFFGIAAYFLSKKRNEKL